MKRILFIIGLLLALLALRNPALAVESCPYAGYCTADGCCEFYCPNNPGAFDPDCNTQGTLCRDAECPSIGQSSFCCDTGQSCSPNLGENCNTVGPWTYCYNPECKVRKAGFYCDWYWSFTSCGAYDTCFPSDGPYLRAGRCGVGESCDETGCRVGGIYKTCCKVDANGNLTGELADSCVGGCRSGYCPSGSVAIK